MSVAVRLEQRIPPVAGRFWLMGALVLVVAPHLWRMPIWFALGCGGLIGWRLLRDLKGWDLPGRLVSLAFTVGGITAVAATYHSVLGREPGVALLTVMLCLKLLELRTVRDAMVVVFLGYFLVVSAFLFSQSVFIGGYMFAVVVALTTALVAINHPAATLGHSRGYLKLAGSLLLQALPMMLVLFVLFPRIPGPLWSLPNDAHGARTGLSDEMAFGAITDLADSDEVAFRVKFQRDVPAANRLYWRGPVFWFTDGSRWTGLGADSPRARLLGDPAYQANDAAVEYTVTLEPHNRRWLFALDLPADVPPGATVRADFQMLADKPVTDLRRYSMRSHLHYNTGELDDDQLFLALALPEDVNPETRRLAESWLARGLDDDAIAAEAMRLFREEPFYYTRQPPKLDGLDPIDSFLFETRRGFCEHYAAAFVTLMRAADIPARVVTGYQGGERNGVGDYLIVRQSDAHAWAEAWLRGRGWVRMDPTAMIPPQRIITADDAQRFASTTPQHALGAGVLVEAWQRLRYGWDAMNHAWNQWVLGFDDKSQQQLLRNLGLGLDWGRMLLLALAISATLLAGVSLYLLRPQRLGKDPANRLYERYCRKLAQRDLQRRPEEGPVDFAQRVVAARRDLCEPVERITRLYTEVRYGTAGNGELGALAAAVKQFRP